MKKGKVILFTCIMLLFLCLPKTNVSAKKLNTVTVTKTEDDGYDFEVKDNSVSYFSGDFKLSSGKESSGKDGVRMVIEGYSSEEAWYENEKPIYRDTADMKMEKGEKEGGWFYYPDKGVEPKGYYFITFYSLTNNKIEVSFEQNTYKGYATSAKVSKYMTIEIGDYEKINITNLKSDNTLLAASVSGSNKKVAEIYSDGKSVYVYGKKAGSSTISIKLSNGTIYKTKLTVKTPKPYIKWSSYELYKGESFKNSLVNSNGKVTWSSTNKKVATVSSKGNVKAVGTGTCYIKAKWKGKTYKTKVIVSYESPNFYSELTSYNTRLNTFTVKIKNYSKKSVTIYSSNAKSEDKDYKEYDRKLKLSGGKSSITIKAGESKKVSFKIIGYYTWPDVSSHNVYFDFRYDGKKYRAWVDYGDCGGYKKGNSWKYTMQNY